MPRTTTLVLGVILLGVAACTPDAPGAASSAEPVEWFVAPSGDDTNRGTSAPEAFRTITHAVGAASPGDSVYVLPGEYSERLAFEGLGGGDAPLRIMGINGLPVIAAADGITVGIECHRCVNVDISCLDLRGFGDAAILLDGSTDVAVRDVVIAGPGRDGVRIVGSDGVLVEWLDVSGLTDPAGAAVRLQGVTDAVVANNRAHGLAGSAWVFTGSEVAAERNEVVGED